MAKKISFEEEPTCLLAKISIVIADEEVQIMVSNVTCLERQAVKVDRISVDVRDLECQIQLPKVLITGTLHKQIFYVTRENRVLHQSEDIPFTKMIENEELEELIEDLTEEEMRELEEMLECQFFNLKIDQRFELIRATRVQQTAIIRFLLKISRIEQILLPQLGTLKGTIVCPNDEPPEFFAVKLFDENDFLIGKLFRFVMENEEAKFRFVSLPAPATYKLVVVAVCRDDHKIFKRVIEVEVDPCLETVVDIELKMKQSMDMNKEAAKMNMPSFPETWENLCEMMKKISWL